MAKEGPSSQEGFDLPPPYSHADPASFAQPESSASSSIFSPQLASLRSQILAEEAARSSARDERDNQLLTLIVPYVETILSSISAMNPAPALAEAILIPEDAVGLEWTLSDEDEERPGVISRVVRVKTRTKKDKVQQDAPEDNSEWNWTGNAGRTSDQESSSDAWWTNEGMARRLARNIEPDRVVTNLPLARTGQPSQNKQEKSSRWKVFGNKSETSASSSRSSAVPRSEASSEATMTAKAEEVTFRRENAFGIWESKSGWGIVLRIRIPRA